MGPVSSYVHLLDHSRFLSSRINILQSNTIVRPQSIRRQYRRVEDDSFIPHICSTRMGRRKLPALLCKPMTVGVQLIREDEWVRPHGEG